MDAFHNSLNEALRYHTEQERKSFEDAIDANPLEATTHLVYADWLQENGEPEEAAFRRAMGEWVKDGGRQSKVPDGFPTLHGLRHWWAEAAKLPAGVRPSDLPASDDFNTWNTPQPEHIAYSSWGPHLPSRVGNFNWRSYRGMEEAFRRAFKANRKFTSE